MASFAAGEEMRGDAQRLDGFRDRVAGAHHVADAQAGRELHIDFARAQLGRLVLVVGPQAGVADALPADGVVFAIHVRDGLDGVGARGHVACGSNGKHERLGVARALEMEGLLRGIGAPAFGQLQIDGSFGRVLGVDGDADGQRRTVERQNAGFGFDAHADGGRDDERLVDAAHSVTCASVCTTMPRRMGTPSKVNSAQALSGYGAKERSRQASFAMS